VTTHSAAHLSRSDLADLNAFRAVERQRSFTKAAVELGITTSALSHAIRNLETRLGVRLLNRTSRTVSPTEAGASLALRLNIGFREISEALDNVNHLRVRPAGRLRLNVQRDGASLIIARHLPEFLRRYPEMEVDISVSDHMTDSVTEGFDADIRSGSNMPGNMVAIKLEKAWRRVAVASPRYLYYHSQPEQPEDLRTHACIRLRTGQGIIRKWHFSKDGERRIIDVPGQICVNDATLAIALALAGTGIAWCLEQQVSQHLAEGSLRTVLSDWSPVQPALHLYYPKNRAMPQGLSELIELLREETDTGERHLQQLCSKTLPFPVFSGSF